MNQFLGIAALLLIIVATLSSCANIIPPVGGPRDTLSPIVLRSTPESGTRNFRGNRITLQFDEYVTVENAFENVIVTPTQDNFPIIDSRLRTVSIRLKDTLEPNTTYAIHFGNAIKDVNESNPLRNFNYVFPPAILLIHLLYPAGLPLRKPVRLIQPLSSFCTATWMIVQ